MNIYILLSLVAATIYLLVAIFVYSRKKLSRLNESFAIMLLCVSIWNIDVAGILGAPTPEIADFWGKLFRNGLLFIPPTFLHFVVIFTNPQGASQPARKVILASYFISCFFAVVNWTPYFTRGVRVSPWGYHAVSGPLYPVFLLQFIACIFLSIYYLIRGFIQAESYQRHRLKYFVLAMSIGVIIGGFNFLPMFGGEVYIFGTVAVMVSLMVMSYTLVRNRLMDVSVFMAKGLSYILSLALLAIPIFFLILFLEKAFFLREDIPLTITLILIGIASIFVFNFIKIHLDQAMRQIIVKGKYEYARILEDFSRRLVTIVDLNRLLSMLADTIEKSMAIAKISVFLHEPEKDFFRAHLIRGSPEEEIIKISAPTIQYLKEKKEAILRYEIEQVGRVKEEDELLKIMGQSRAEVLLPLVYMDRLIGFINLGSKPGGEMYYREDLDLLYPLGNQVAIAIENANLYENLKKSQTIIRRADRLASLGTLVASLAHEIRNPLVSIKTFTQLLPERMEDEEFRNYFVRIASGEIDRLTSLINELLGFARPAEPRLALGDVNDLIEKMEFLVATEARKKNITITKGLSPDLPHVRMDGEQVKQVLINLLLNAIQAITGEGQIWIETRIVHVSLEDKTQPFAQIEVRDTGIGIPKENMERIFDPFFSTRPEGSGLGLAISHQIIHDQGGFISVDSEVGKGSSFKIHLPLNQGGMGAVQA